MRSERLRLVVLGMFGYSPVGGMTWLYLNWLRGLTRLGHDVYYVEDHRMWPWDPLRNRLTDDCRYATAHIAACAARIGLEDRWAFRLDGGACWGMESDRIDALYASCDAILNIVGTELRDVHMAAPLRVYVETDPVITQLRIAGGDERLRAHLERHEVLLTYGENYGAPDCGVPLGGHTFVPCRQPVDLDLWPMSYDPAAPLFTTIGNYRTRDHDVTWNGETYRWSKHHEWERFLDLPRRCAQPFELAMTVYDDDDRRHLERHGWRVVSPSQMSLDVFGQYPEYVRRSRAEFTVAKDQNVRLRSGWFSERDACYLASGKPVIAQDTGFGCALPVGEGLFAVGTVDEAAAAVDAVNSDYERHCRAARDIAEEHLEAAAVARRMLVAAGLEA